MSKKELSVEIVSSIYKRTQCRSRILRSKKASSYSLRENFLIGVKVDGVHLSGRESECVFYLIRGMSARQISDEMFLSPRTIEFHMVNIKNKLNCRSRSELIAKILDSGFPYKINNLLYNEP